MNTKHTEGDWKVSDRLTNGVEGYEIHWSEDGECITDHVYTLADAKLIAAAPELLKALIDLKNQFSRSRIPSRKIALENADKAIKKATL